MNKRFIITDNAEYAKNSTERIKLLTEFSEDSVWSAMVDYLFSNADKAIFVSSNPENKTFADQYGVEFNLVKSEI